MQVQEQQSNATACLLHLTQINSNSLLVPLQCLCSCNTPALLFVLPMLALMLPQLMPSTCFMKWEQAIHFFLSILLAGFVQSHIYQLLLGYSGLEFSIEIGMSSMSSVQLMRLYSCPRHTLSYELMCWSFTIGYQQATSLPLCCQYTIFATYEFLACTQIQF